MATTDEQADHDDQTITLREQPEGGWAAIDEETGVVSQGETRMQALDNLDEALDAYYGRNSHPPSEHELRDIGIDPENNQPGEGDAPHWRE